MNKSKKSLEIRKMCTVWLGNRRVQTKIYKNLKKKKTKRKIVFETVLYVFFFPVG